MFVGFVRSSQQTISRAASLSPSTFFPRTPTMSGARAVRQVRLKRGVASADEPRLSAVDESDGEDGAWERVSQLGSSISGSACGSVCGNDDATIDDLVGEWAMIGPIGEDGPPAASWDILEAKDLLPDSLHSHSRTSSRDGSRPTTPSSSASSSLAERTCAGPFAMRRRNMKKNRPVMWRQPTLSTAAACGAQAAAPAATIDLS